MVKTMAELFNIRNKRLEAGLSIREVARAAGVQAGKLGRIEKRKEPCPWDYLQKLSAYYNCPISELI